MPRSREREIKERIRVRVEKKEKNRVQEFFTHTTSFLILVVLWTNLIVGVQTAARGAVCVFCRSRLEIQEKVLRVIL